MSRAAELLQSHAEVMKLARLLDRDPESLAYLERLSADDLRELRDSVTEQPGSRLGFRAHAPPV